MMTRSGSSFRSSFSTCSSCSEISMSGSRYAARVAKPRGGNNEYLTGRQKGLVASVNAGRMNFTRLIDDLAFTGGLLSLGCRTIAFGHFRTQQSTLPRKAQTQKNLQLVDAQLERRMRPITASMWFR